MFYEFNQNNSGGSFVFDQERGLTHFVIIEADSPDDANSRAEDIGIYFDGCNQGYDCPCCGDRWYEQYGYDKGNEVPSLYGEPVETAELSMAWMGDNPEVFIHYKDGRVEGISPPSRY